MKPPLLCQLTIPHRAVMGEELLMIAVFEDAYQCFLGRYSPQDRVKADRWFFESRPSYPFSFVSICHHFGLSEHAIRERIKHERVRFLEVKHKPNKSKSRGLVLRYNVIAPPPSPKRRSAPKPVKKVVKPKRPLSPYEARCNEVLQYLTREWCTEEEIATAFAQGAPTVTHSTFVHNALPFLKSAGRVEERDGKWKRS